MWVASSHFFRSFLSDTKQSFFVPLASQTRFAGANVKMQKREIQILPEVFLREASPRVQRVRGMRRKNEGKISCK